MLEISHVRKHFGKQEVLKDVTLKVNKGGCDCHFRPFRLRQNDFS